MAVQYDAITGLPKTKKTGTKTGYDPFKPVFTAVADPGAGGGPAARPGTVTLPGFMPDYKKLIETNPFYLDAVNALKTQGVQSAAQRAAARQRAIIEYGQVPDFLKAGKDLGMLGDSLGEDLTPEILAAAQGNTEAGLSTSARLSKAHSDALRQIQNQLGARGLARSGETGFQLEQENQNYAQGTYDSTQKLLDYLGGVQAAFTQAEMERERAKIAAAQAAAQQESGLHPPTGAVTLPWDPAKGAYGPDKDGNYYDVNGNKITPGTGGGTGGGGGGGTGGGGGGGGTGGGGTPPPGGTTETPPVDTGNGGPTGPGMEAKSRLLAPPSMNDLWKLING